LPGQKAQGNHLYGKLDFCRWQKMRRPFPDHFPIAERGRERRKKSWKKHPV